jgi:hypothetical protein
MDLKPSTHIVYPPFKNGLYMEEYFCKYWENSVFAEKSNFVYLDIFWHNLFQNAGGNTIEVMKKITPLVIQKCEDAEREGKIIFSLYQWDDGISLHAERPNNLILFAIAGNNKSSEGLDIPLPLIVEDKANRLYNIKRTSLDERKLLCSFVGTLTHDVRVKIYDTLKNVDGFHFSVKPSWTFDIPESMVHQFINISRISRFGLAPRGYGPSSFRFFELMQLGVIPVYVHDDENGLPYTDILDYSLFSVTMHIDDIQNLPAILKGINDEQYIKMLHELESVKDWFTPDGICNYVKEYLVDSFCCQEVLNFFS